MLIHPTFNFVLCYWPKSRNASPKSSPTTTMLHSLMDMLRSNTFSIFNPTLWPTILVKPIYFCLITKYHTFTIINGPILIPLSTPQACENMFTTQNWFLLLHVCTKSSLSQSIPYNDVKQFTCFILNLSCCHKCSSKSTFSNKSDTTPPLVICKKLEMPSSMSLNLAPYILPQMRYGRLALAH